MPINKDLATFERFLPPASVKYCYELWLQYKFHFKITRPRQSKLGDYCYHSEKGHTITVNGNLNTYAFLVTYIHEVAHLQVFTHYKRRKEPHGAEWKRFFKETFTPLLTEEVMPIAILKPLQDYLENPLASTQKYEPLNIALQAFDEPSDLVMVSTLPEGAVFQLNSKIFVKGELRRTRFLCKELKTGKQYLVPSVVMVKRISDL
jgi:SprT protein